MLWFLGAGIVVAILFSLLVLLPFDSNGGQQLGQMIPSRAIRTLEKRLANLHLQFDDQVIYMPQEELRAGYHTAYQPTAEANETILIDLGEVLEIDMIALAPVYLRQNEKVQAGYGFPKRFKIESSEDLAFSDPHLLVDQTAADFNLADRYPILYPTPVGRGRYVRMTITRLAGSNGVYFAALGEFLVISGQRNAALWRPLRVSSSVEANLRWSADYLVDEFSLLSAPVIDEPSDDDGYVLVGDVEYPPLNHDRFGEGVSD